MTARTPLSRAASAPAGGTSNLIPVPRILRLARASRCARVGSGVKNAAAISRVVSPATYRKVSATLTSDASAG